MTWEYMTVACVGLDIGSADVRWVNGPVAKTRSVPQPGGVRGVWKKHAFE